MREVLSEDPIEEKYRWVNAGNMPEGRNGLMPNREGVAVWVRIPNLRMGVVGLSNDLVT